jgi:hypothetical protein
MASPMDYELDDSLQNSDSQAQRPKRPKRPTKSVNENLEPAYTGTLAASPEQAHYLPLTELGSADFGAEALDSWIKVYKIYSDWSSCGAVRWI